MWEMTDEDRAACGQIGDPRRGQKPTPLPSGQAINMSDENDRVPERTYFEHPGFRAVFSLRPLVLGHTLILSDEPAASMAVKDRADQERKNLHQCILAVKGIICRAFNVKEFILLERGSSPQGEGSFYPCLHVIPGTITVDDAMFRYSFDKRVSWDSFSAAINSAANKEEGYLLCSDGRRSVYTFSPTQRGGLGLYELGEVASRLGVPPLMAQISNPDCAMSYARRVRSM